MRYEPQEALSSMDEVAEDPSDLALTQRQRIAKQVWLVGSQPCIQNAHDCDSRTIWIHFLFNCIQLRQRIKRTSSHAYALVKYDSLLAACFTSYQVEAKTCRLRHALYLGSSMHGDFSCLLSNRCLSSRFHNDRQERPCRRSVFGCVTCSNIDD